VSHERLKPITQEYGNTGMSIMNNLFLLWKQILKNPRELGTVAPSSPYLAKCVVSSANINPSQYVVEIGAGTGPITRHIIKEVDPNKFCIVEPNAEMLQSLREEYPKSHHSAEYVQQLESVTSSLGWKNVDVVVSSLPWSIFPRESVIGGLEAIHSVLRSNGKVLTLVYSHAQYFPSSLYLEHQFNRYFEHVYRTRTTWRNVPPGYFLVGERPRTLKLSQH